MKRSVLVAAGTAVGVTAVVSYHAATPSTGVSLASASTGASKAASSRSTTASGSASSADRTSAKAAAHTATTSSSTTSSTTTTHSSSSAATTRSALGEAVSYQYGELQVKVTEHGGRITNVSIARFDIPDPHSDSIDQYAVPQLRAEVLSAQSAHIDGISGASYTSQAYAQSVQSALDKLA